MKRMTATILMLCVLAGLVLIPGVSSADTVYATVRDTVRISTGPGDQYGELPDLKLYRGDQVRVLTKHNNGNETWLQVEFNYSARSRVRGYVRYADVSAELRRVPTEAPLCTGRIVVQNAQTATGPFSQGYLAYLSSVRANTSGIIYEVEDGYAHIEYWSYAEGEKWRSWISLDDLQTDWYFSSTGYYGVAKDSTMYYPSPTKSPSTYYGSTKGYPVGKMFTVISGSCHVKRGAGTEFQTVEYAYVGERYEVLECKTGSTGKDWYRIKINGAYGWISSGLVSLD